MYVPPIRRSLIAIVAIIGAFTMLPFLLHKFFSLRLPDTQFVVHQRPRPLPIFTFLDAFGHSLTLNHLLGSILLVNVWATLCPPCKAEMASLNRLASLLANKTIKIVPIYISSVVTVRTFYKKFGLNNLLIYVDPSKTVMDALQVTGIPTTLLIGQDERGSRPSVWCRSAVAKPLASALPIAL